MIKFILAFGFFLVLLLPFMIAIFSALIYGAWRMLTFETRFRRFFAKYKNDEVARMIAGGKIWTGQTDEQLRDAKGSPLQVIDAGDEKIWVYKPHPLTKRPVQITVRDERVTDWTS